MKRFYLVFIALMLIASTGYGDVTELKKNVFNAEQVFKHGITVNDYITLDGQDVINTIGKVWYVKSTTGSNTLGNNYGKSRTKPFATVDFAINQSASGDIIAVLPGHAESFSAANGFDADVAGITIVGLGTDTEMPEFTFADTDATVAIGAAGVKILNLMIRAGISEVVTGISIEATGDGAILDGLYFVQPGTSTFEFDKAIVLAAGADRVTVQRCYSYRTAATGATSWLEATAGVVNQLTIRDNVVYGEYSVAPIYSDQVNIDVTLMDNAIQNLTTGQFGIEFSAATTGTYGGNMVYTDGGTTAIDPGSMKAVKPNWIVTAIDKSPVMFPAQDDTAENLIGVNDADNAATTSAVVANVNGSILERNEVLQAAALPSKSHPNYFTVTADMTSATWNTAAAHEIATVTGACRVQIIVETTATIVTTGTNGTIALGFEGNASAIFSATALDAAVTGDVFSAVYGSAATSPASGADAQSALTHGIFDVIVATGKDIGYTIATNAATTGTLTFHVYWTPLDSTGAVVAGAGGVL